MAEKRDRQSDSEVSSPDREGKVGSIKKYSLEDLHSTI